MLPRDGRYPNFGILDFLDDRDRGRLISLLSDLYSSHEWDEIKDNQDAPTQGFTPHLPGAYISNFILCPRPHGLGAGSAVIEREYVDRDTNIAYNQTHARAFREYPRRTTRLHFFLGHVNYQDFLRESSLQQKTYLGFCVLCPSRPRTIARAVLPASGGNSLFDFVPAETEFFVNLAGARLRAVGTAFVEQDGRVAACASAAAWMSTTILSKKWADTPAYSVSEITQFATKHSLPPEGSGVSPGLTVPQILWGLHEMGYEPMVHAVRDQYEAKELIYLYVESGIPPILVTLLPSEDGFHAITALGHTYDPHVIETSLHSTSAWCPHFTMTKKEL